MTKMTYAMALETVIATLEDGEVKEKLTALKASVEKKNSTTRKPTATQKANAEFKEAILATMEVGTRYTITDLMKSVDVLADLSNQRVSAIVRQMKEDGLIVREEIKRKAYFSLATEE